MPKIILTQPQTDQVKAALKKVVVPQRKRRGKAKVQAAVHPIPKVKQPVRPGELINALREVNRGIGELPQKLHDIIGQLTDLMIPQDDLPF